MAEKAQGIQNKWLLLIALALGAITVLIYNAHIKALKSEMEGTTFEALVFTHNMEAGERVTVKDIQTFKIRNYHEGSIPNITPASNLKTIVAEGGKVLLTKVGKDELLRNDMFQLGIDTGDKKLPSGHVMITVDFDADQSPGDVLRPGSAVNLIGLFSLDGGRTYKPYRVIERVGVVTVGGAGSEDKAVRAGGDASRNYRRIGLDVTQVFSLQWLALRTHLRGALAIELTAEGVAENPMLNKDLLPLAASAAAIKSPGGIIAPPPSTDNGF